jgi:calcineurin-like phosphoesterase family protein
MTTFFTSDQHYGHKNICRFSDRPYKSVEEMNESLIEKHNAVVTSQDVVWYLGDFAFMPPDETKNILRRLNGQKNLILGNHDKNFIKNGSHFIGKGMLNAIYHYHEISVEKQPIILFHYGMRVWNKSHYGAWLLYGHSHGSLPPYGKSVDVGVDSKEITDDYRPVAFEEVKRFMDKRDNEIIDHHE